MDRIAIIFGGVSAEHDVSVVSATSVAGQMDRELFEPVYVAIDKSGSWFLGDGAFDLLKGTPTADVRRVVLSCDPNQPGFIALDDGALIEVDAIFPVLHGPRGEDGTVQGLFELSGLPYVGCDTTASAVSMDKDLTKRILSQRGIPVVKGTCLTNVMWESSRDEVLAEIRQTLKLPLFIKPATMGSSIGITKAENEYDILDGIEEALEYSHKVIVEEAVSDMLEIEVAVLGNREPRASVPGQIIPNNEYYDFDAKYVDGSSELVIPARLERTNLEEIQFMALEAFEAVGGCGLARVDFLVTRDACYVNEINTLPGFTSISMYPKLWEASGLPYGDLITKLIELAKSRKSENDELTKTIVLEKSLGV